MRIVAAIGRFLKDAWLMAGVSVVLFTILEAGASLALHLRQGVRPVGESVPDWRVRADAYSDGSWVRDYYAEFRSSDAVRWMPYVYWRRGAYHGKYINVDENGIRRTTAPAPPPDSGTSVTIFMFGGSTLWGTGARDAFTIPSLVTRDLLGKGLRPEITNFGESGYVSTQELVALLLELRDGRSPDLVIFYDGINDTGAALQERVAGLPQNEANRVREFNLSSPARLTQRAVLLARDAASRLAIVRLVGVLAGRSATAPAIASESAAPRFRHSTADDAGLSASVVQTYWKNVELVKALGEHYGFACLFYWQPTIFQKPRLTGYEAAERRKAEYLTPFFEQTYTTMRRSRLAHPREPAFHDLSTVFSDLSAPVFVDWAHLGESGNEIIARRMAGDVLETLQAASGARRASRTPTGRTPRPEPGVHAHW